MSKSTQIKPKPKTKTKKNQKSMSKMPVNALKRMKKNFDTVKYAPKHTSMWFRFLLITIAALIVTFALDLFIHPARLYPGGLRVVQYIISGTVPWVEARQWAGYLIFFAINVPLAYLGFKYVGVKFTILTLYFLLIQTAFSYGLNELKTVEHFTVFNFDKSIANGTFINDPIRFLAAIIGAFIYGIGIALTFIAGGSSGGSKFIVAWISKKYKLSLGKIGIYIAIVMVTMAILIVQVGHEGINVLVAFISVQAFATALFITIQNLFINQMAPRTKRTRIEIQTSQSALVKKVILGSILETRTWYSYKILKNEDKKYSTVFVIIIDKRETEHVLRKLHKRIPSAYITAYDVLLKTKYFNVRTID